VSDILGLVVEYGYLVVFAVVLLENLGLPLPGILVLGVAGALAGAGKLSMVLVVLLAVAGALLGDLVWYGLGRGRGRPVLGFLCRLSLNPDTCVGQAERFFLRHGMPALLVAKFVPGLNTIAPPLMGTLRARFGRFLAWDAGGAVLFSVVTVGVGYVLGFEIVARTQAAIAQVGVLVGWGLAAFALAYLGWRLAVRLRVRRALRTVGLTPGELRRRLEEGADIAVIDVRSPLALSEHPRRIPGALHAAQEALRALAAEWPRDREIVTYCV
jgi:membrane protein DedA with SNARE-associated domain